MNCATLKWVADQDDLAPHLQGILLRLVKLMDDDGRISLAQAKIAPHVGLGERQTRQAIKDLVGKGALVRKRQGAVRKGRAPDLLSANFERQRDNGSTSPVSAEISDNGEAPPLPPLSTKTGDKLDTGGASPLSRKKPDNGDNAAASPVSEFEDAEFVDNPPAPCIGTGARAETLNLNTSGSEIHPDTPSVCGARERANPMPNGGGNLDPDWTLTDEQRAFANERGFLNGSCDELFGQFIDHCVTKGPRISTGWKSEWRKWVRNQVKFDTERAERAPKHEKSYDQSPSAYRGQSGNGGRALSTSSEILLQKIARGRADEERRLEPHAGK